MPKKTTGPGLFRLFLSMVVVVHHFSRLAFGSGAVFVFFCLSGFWIFRMYSERYSGAKHPYITYLVSRFWRLLPTFWIISLLTFTYIFIRGDFTRYYRQNHLAHFVLSSCFIYGYSTLNAKPIVPAWSLDIEMQYYLIAPLLAIVLMRRMVRPTLLLGLTGAFSLISVATGNSIPLLSYLVFFMVGMVAASANWRPPNGLVIWSLFINMALIAGCLVSPWRGILLVGAHATPLAIYNPYANVLAAFIAIPYAIYTTGQRGAVADGMFGDLSYVVYLLHWGGSLYYGEYHGGLFHRLGRAVVAFGVVIGLSYLIWKFWDKPINATRARWVKARLKQKVGELSAPEKSPTAVS